MKLTAKFIRASEESRHFADRSDIDRFGVVGDPDGLVLILQRHSDDKVLRIYMTREEAQRVAAGLLKAAT